MYAGSTCVYTLAYKERGFNFPPSLVGKGVRGLGFALTFPHNVKSQDIAGIFFVEY